MHPILKGVKLYLRIEKYEVFLSAPFSATLFEGKMQLGIPTVSLLSSSTEQ